jgi:hypothetical protein
MADHIRDGTGSGSLLRIGQDNRAYTYATTEPIGGERSLAGQLFGAGTGSLTLDGGESTAPMLWIQNNDPDNLYQVDKVIYGWNGGSTNFNRTCFCLISYQVSEPSAANTSINANIENISRSGTSAAVTDSKLTAHKWDGTGSSGMTGGSGGYGQISNRIAQGDTSLGFIAGQIILGQGDTMQISVTPEEAGLFNAAIVYWKIPVGGRK